MSPNFGLDCFQAIQHVGLVYVYQTQIDTPTMLHTYICLVYVYYTHRRQPYARFCLVKDSQVPLERRKETCRGRCPICR